MESQESTLKQEENTAEQQSSKEEYLWRKADVLIRVAGATNRFADTINGVYDVVAGSNSGGGSVYKSKGMSSPIEYMASCNQWQIKLTSDLGKDLCLAYLSCSRPFPLRNISTRVILKKHTNDSRLMMDVKLDRGLSQLKLLHPVILLLHIDTLNCK